MVSCDQHPENEMEIKIIQEQVSVITYLCSVQISVHSIFITTGEGETMGLL